ncbi:MAG: hypothetical protein QNK26_14195 [Moritella sp.]|uniref:hypothetical protein n=1 Tax=Moritella sp. TaxID=78556 RepID=UPI0029ADF30E|nr:hypothetical protein [Moritella sp.]MDX2321734.1 hypothetical protein [Moritella sp.]
MRVTKPTNNANISLLLIVVFLIACMVNNAFSFNPQVSNNAQLETQALTSLTAANDSANYGSDFQTTLDSQLANASYLESNDGVCKLTEKLLQKASTHVEELVMIILMIILFSHYFTRQSLNLTYLTNTFFSSQRRHLILCKFDE